MFAKLIISALALAQAVTAAPTLHKRNDGEATYYAAGLGACGGTNSGSDFIVALNQPMWDGGAHCGQQVTISYGGKTTQATIVDLCPGCSSGDLDMSESLFKFFASTDVGRFKMSWSYGGGGGGSPANLQADAPPASSSTPEPAPTPTPEYTPPPQPTSTWVAPTTTSTEQEPSSTSSTESSTTPSSTSSSAPASSSSSLASSSASASITSTSTHTAPLSTMSITAANATAAVPLESVTNNSDVSNGNLGDINDLVSTFGRIIAVSAQA